MACFLLLTLVLAVRRRYGRARNPSPSHPHVMLTLFYPVLSWKPTAPANPHRDLRRLGSARHALARSAAPTHFGVPETMIEKGPF